MDDDLVIQQATSCNESSPNELKPDNDAKRPKHKNGGRKDRGRLHAVRDSVLTRGLMEILTRYGENLRKLRRMEAELRTALKPEGPLGSLLFGRFWQCVLRLILLGHLEARGLTPSRNIGKNPTATASLREGVMPILVTGEESDNASDISDNAEVLQPDLFHRLALIARYDRTVSREMFRCLSLLIVMRDGGEDGLGSAIRAVAGIKARDGEGN